ncbi:TAT-variant-translocated molybdopterin oxidoreductase [Sporocytophaga myxococcoides]|uniref:TAT-variant-translocated molybdopterin oxidoreductase n=1 Tax=Sporocytophaga myxococcoides TaxID=153721 RepID=UPI00040D34C9|nr:TAT-variant-translocated molybdopterin oxidoreductase [Sporocytophaga myxococcoides]
MKDNNKKYWKGIEELSNDPEFLKHAHNEFPEFLSVKEKGSSDASDAPDRRDFLKLLGFSVAAVSLAACEAPVKKVIPYVNKPVDVDPGIANWYASTYQEGGEYCSILVKTREGRPIKIEGNKLSPVTMGGTSARVQASVLSLYDTERLEFFVENGKAVKVKSIAEYAPLDRKIKDKLAAAQASGKSIKIVSQTILSPTTKKVIEEFKAKYPATEHVMYDVLSAEGILKANEISLGQRIIPSYNFAAADVIVSFGADFLGSWISPIEYAKQYSKTRKLSAHKKTMSKHYQIESNLSLTGCNADTRLPIKPSEEGLYVAALYNALGFGGLSTKAPNHEVIKKAAADLLKAKGKSLVVSGSNDPYVQLLVNKINSELGNYGKTIDVTTPSFQKQGSDEAILKFIDDAKSGQVGAVIFYGANPVYDHPKGEELKEALKKISLKISFNDRMDETSSEVDYVCPDLHFLESWNDAEPKKGFFSLTQPTITPIFKGNRAAQESLLIWSGNKTDYYTYLENSWKSRLTGGNFQELWDKTLHDGLYSAGKTSELHVTPGHSETEAYAAISDTAAVGAFHTGGSSTPNVNLSEVEDNINRTYKTNSGIELSLYYKVGLGSGSLSAGNNPWLHELPDPVSKATWDNYLAIPKKMANEMDITQGDVVALTVDGKNTGIEVPVLIQPGQANNTASLALGYGRTKAGKCGNEVGKNAYPLIKVKGGRLDLNAGVVTFAKTGDERKIAQTQTHHTVMARPIIQDASLAEYQKDAGAGRFKPMIHTNLYGEKKPTEITTWYEHEKPNHLWGMSIDLNSCIGCGACVVACQSENNVPVVGRKEVLNRREMHWIRIDRYYSSDAETDKTGEYFESESGVKDLEIAAENPTVTFQPMLCQQCNHAPCESVCPVAATTHSSEGLNQMTYNRCIGTRYCANNCPYKVRRFNWFKYFENEDFDKNVSMNNFLGRMVLNPDVTVRSRGVMEKCSFCVQRIQEGKLKAKMEKRRPIDGEIVTACASACPTDAIIFGDRNDSESRLHKDNVVENAERSYAVLEELNVQPNILYLTKIRNS